MDNGKDTEILLRLSRRNVELLTAAYDILPLRSKEAEQIHVTYNSTDTEALQRKNRTGFPSILPSATVACCTSDGL